MVEAEIAGESSEDGDRRRGAGCAKGSERQEKRGRKGRERKGRKEKRVRWL